MNLKFDTEQRPENAIFSGYQNLVLDAIEINGKSPIGNKDIWDYVNENGVSISRASVINFTDKLHMLDLLVGVQQSGKGGTRFAYTFPEDRTHFNSLVSTLFMGSLVEAFPTVDLFKVLRLIYNGSKS